MADMMNFPKRWEDFLHDYEFEDARRIYTNGSRLIPSFRVKQMMEHYAPVRHGRWMCHGDCGVTECSVCGWSIEEYVCDYAYCPNRIEEYVCDYAYCPNCGADMRGSNDE